MPLVLLAACLARVPEEGSAAPWLEHRASYTGPEDYVYDLAWSPADDLLVTGGASSLRLFRVDPVSGAPTLLDVATGDGRFNSVTWSAAGDLVIAPSGDRLRLYPVVADAFGAVVEGPALAAEQQRAALAADQQTLLACDRDGGVTLHRLDLAESSVQPVASLSVHERCTRVALSPDGHQGLSVGREGLLALYAVEPADGTLTLVDSLPFDHETGEAIFAGDETHAFVGIFGGDDTLWSVDVDPGVSLQTRDAYAGHASGIDALEIDHAGRYLVSGGHDHSTHLWRLLGDGDLQLVYDHPDAGTGVHSARFSRDDGLLAVMASKLDQLDIFAMHDPE